MRMYVVYHKQSSYNNINNTNSKTQVQNSTHLLSHNSLIPYEVMFFETISIVGENPKPLLGGARVKVRGVRA